MNNAPARVMGAEVVNEELREHVTSVGFSLTLTRNQIDMLIILHYFRGFPPQRHHGRRWVPTARGLASRGLIEVKGWSLTKAGHLTVALLREAGLYQERAEKLSLSGPRQPFVLGESA